MRSIVACPECARQYDATGKRPGLRFRCRCGKRLKVAEPESHEAAVVRCSSCGAAREKGSRRCGFCSADFTLHERDLHTVCPQCLVRISDRAKFCHHCGTRIAPEEAAWEKSDLDCPRCDPAVPLHSRRIANERVNVLECDACTGLWLGHDAFDMLKDRAVEEARLAQTATGATYQPKISVEKTWTYRKCPVCQKLMGRRNYGRQSGVVIDICREHGIWFDPRELEHLLAWIRSGGLAKANERQRKRTLAKEREERRRRIREQASAGPILGPSEPTFGSPSRTETILFDTLFELFDLRM